MKSLDVIYDWRFFWLSGWFIMPLFIGISVVLGILYDRRSRARPIPTPEDIRRGQAIGRWGARLFIAGVAAYVVIYLVSR